MKTIYQKTKIKRNNLAHNYMSGSSYSYLIIIFIFVLLFCLFRKESKKSFDETEKFIMEPREYHGNIHDYANLEIWLKNFLKEFNHQQNLYEVELISIDKNYQGKLSTVVWLNKKNQFFNNEFTDHAKPWIINWKQKNDSDNLFYIDSMKPYKQVGTLPFIKNQNQQYANLFEIAMKITYKN